MNQSNRLLPCVCIINDMEGSCHTTKSFVFVIQTQEASTMSHRSFNFENIGGNSLDYLFPVHGYDRLFLFIDVSACLRPK